MSTASEIRDQLEQTILMGSLEAGQRVNENALATRYGVSRTVIREALRSLENEGLVEFHENKGALVRQPTVPDIMQLYDVRAGLSATAARLAAANATTDQIAALEGYQRELSQLRDSNHQEAYNGLNIAFHDLIFVASGNNRLKQIHDSVSKEMRLFVRRGVSGMGGLRTSFFEHERILGAIKEGNAAEAAAAFEAHVHSGKMRMLDGLYGAIRPSSI
jgi:DNA-binding GntR family transcriptional regulator